MRCPCPLRPPLSSCEMDTAVAYISGLLCCQGKTHILAAVRGRRLVFRRLLRFARSSHPGASNPVSPGWKARKGQSRFNPEPDAGMWVHTPHTHTPCHLVQPQSGTCQDHFVCLEMGPRERESMSLFKFNFFLLPVVQLLWVHAWVEQPFLGPPLTPPSHHVTTQVCMGTLCCRP